MCLATFPSGTMSSPLWGSVERSALARGSCGPEVLCGKGGLLVPADRVLRFVSFSATSRTRCPWPLGTTSNVWGCPRTAASPSSSMKVLALGVAGTGDGWRMDPGWQCRAPVVHSPSLRSQALVGLGDEGVPWGGRVLPALCAAGVAWAGPRQASQRAGEASLQRLGAPGAAGPSPAASRRGQRAAGQPGAQGRAAPLPLQGLRAQRLLLPRRQVRGRWPGRGGGCRVARL